MKDWLSVPNPFCLLTNPIVWMLRMTTLHKGKSANGGDTCWIDISKIRRFKHDVEKSTSFFFYTFFEIKKKIKSYKVHMLTQISNISSTN